MDNDNNIVWDRDQAEQATAQDVEEYIQQKIDDYTEIDLSGTELYNEWKADFINFTTATFNKDRDATRTLRNYLRKNGVYVPKSRRPIRRELENTLIEQGEWPEQDKECPAWIPVRQPQPHPQPRHSVPSSPRSEMLSPRMTSAIPQLSTTMPQLRPTESPRKGDQQGQEIHDNQHNHDVRDNRQNGHTRDTRRSSNYNLINLAKLYTDEQKYSRDNDTFDYKFNIFLDLCERTDVPPDIHIKAFPTMLKGAALNYYYTSCKTNPKIISLNELCENI
jgi:hypothetical protein